MRSRAWVLAAALVGCGSQTQQGTTQASASSTASARPRASAAASTSQPVASSAPSSAPSAASAGCSAGSTALWAANATRVELRYQAGAPGNHFRGFVYEPAARKLSVDDSDPFAASEGKSEGPARVTKKSKVLEPSQASELERLLAGVCATPAELERRCAPGGCTSFTVSAPGGERALYDSDAIDPARRWMTKQFPELRTDER
jgi:hypothetical protein